MVPSLKQNIRSNKWLRKEKRQQKKLHLRDEKKLHLRDEKQHLRKRKKQQKEEKDNQSFFAVNITFSNNFFLRKRNKKSLKKRGYLPRFFMQLSHQFFKLNRI